MDALVAVTFVAIGFAAIALAALAVALAGLLQYRLSALLTPETRVIVVLAIVAAGALLSIALTSRTLDAVQRELVNFIAYEDTASGFAASRWLSLVLVGAAVIETIRGTLAARRAAEPDPARSVAWAMLVYYFGTLFVEGVASEHPAFPYKTLYVPFLLLAVYHQRVERLDLVLAAAKWALLPLTAGSLALALVAPDFVLQRPHLGLIPGIDWRLYGLTGHANVIGPAALLAIVIELYSPSRNKTLRALHLVTAGAVLALAQSRTAWAAMLAIMLCVGVPLAMRAASLPGDRELAFRRSVWALVGCLGAGIALALALFAFGNGEAIARALELNTFNGRVQIWDITVQAWKENPLFGYGAEVWGVERQWRFNLFHVGHAHNQFVQTLGEAGLAGLALLCLYVGTLLRAALTRFAETKGIALALLLILLVRFVTEAPMRSEGLLSWSVLLHILIVVFACHALRHRERAGTPVARAQAAPAGRSGRAAPEAAGGALRAA